VSDREMTLLKAGLRAAEAEIKKLAREVRKLKRILRERDRDGWGA